jgi:HEAT repeat protein
VGGHRPCADRRLNTIDDALARFLRDPTDEHARALGATGEAGARRVFDLYFTSDAEPFDDPASGLGREQVDRWSAALGVVAAAQPHVFMDLMAGRDTPLEVIAMLGEVADERAVDILIARAADPDYLVRYNAVQSLARRRDQRSHAALESAVRDKSFVIRAAAIGGIARSEPARALVLYDELLASALPPAFRETVTQSAEKIRRLLDRA